MATVTLVVVAVGVLVERKVLCGPVTIERHLEVPAVTLLRDIQDSLYLHLARYMVLQVDK